MRSIACVFVLITLGTGTATAGEKTCTSLAARPALIAAFGQTLNDYPPRTRPSAVHDPVSVGDGLVIQAMGEIPTMKGIGLRFEIDRAALPVYIDAANGTNRAEVTQSLPQGWASTSHIGMGIVGHVLSEGSVCGYSAVTAGVYDFAFRGNRVRSRGIAANLGFNFASAGRVSTFMEMSFTVIALRSKPPLDASLATLVAVTGGARLRF